MRPDRNQHARRCTTCDGCGIVEDTIYVTREMALDASDLGLEGAAIPLELPCPDCDGTGADPT